MVAVRSQAAANVTVATSTSQHSSFILLSLDQRAGRSKEDRYAGPRHADRSHTAWTCHSCVSTAPPVDRSRSGSASRLTPPAESARDTKEGRAACTQSTYTTPCARRIPYGGCTGNTRRFFSRRKSALSISLLCNLQHNPGLHNCSCRPRTVFAYRPPWFKHSLRAADLSHGVELTRRR